MGWHIEIEESWDGPYTTILADDGTIIAHNETYYPYFNSDYAILMAAAPDLLAALKQTLGYDNHVYGNPPSCCYICKAIAKATN